MERQRKGEMMKQKKRMEKAFYNEYSYLILGLIEKKSLLRIMFDLESKNFVYGFYNFITFEWGIQSCLAL